MISSSAPAIEIDDLAVTYGSVSALDGVSGRFTPGVATAVIGPNGAGKSTLLKAIAGLVAPARGSVRIDADAVAYLPQSADLDRGFPLSAGDLALLGLWRRLGALREAAVSDRARVSAALETVGLGGMDRTLIGALSAGQFQRVRFARLIVQDAPVILLDEPFAGVDTETTRILLRLVDDWRDEGRTIVAVLHDLGQVRRHFSETLYLDRRVLGWGPTDAILAEAAL